jgi:hypothetical protein
MAALLASIEPFAASVRAASEP